MALDIPAFVAAWLALFRHFDAIGYIPPYCTPVYPPHTPALPVAAATDMPLDARITELLGLLPSPPTVDDMGCFELLPRTRPICYRDERVLPWTRDPEMFYIDEPPRAGPDGLVGLLGESEILLTTQLPDGRSLILDIEAGTIREYDASNGPPEPHSYPGDPFHPHNWPALPAVETIRSYVKKFETLEWIAFRGDTEDGIIEPSALVHPHMKKILVETYGWPAAFRREDWIADRDDIWRRVFDEVMPPFPAPWQLAGPRVCTPECAHRISLLTAGDSKIKVQKGVLDGVF